MRKSMTRRRSSTPPSSKSARHRGPTSGSCSTRIGVTARSSGTAITTPAPPTNQRGGSIRAVQNLRQGEKSNGYRRRRLRRGRWRRRRSPCGRRRGSCNRGGRRRWPAVESGQGLGEHGNRGGRGGRRGRDLEPLQEALELGVVVGRGGGGGVGRRHGVRRNARARQSKFQLGGCRLNFFQAKGKQYKKPFEFLVKSSPNFTNEFSSRRGFKHGSLPAISPSVNRPVSREIREFQTKISHHHLAPATNTRRSTIRIYGYIIMSRLHSFYYG